MNNKCKKCEKETPFRVYEIKVSKAGKYSAKGICKICRTKASKSLTEKEAKKIAKDLTIKI